MSAIDIARLRETCAVADCVLVEAQRRLVLLPDAPASIAHDLANVRRILHAGIGRQRPSDTGMAIAPMPCGPALKRGDADGLVRAFPSLLRKGCRTYTALEAHFAADGACWSSGERLAAQFVFHVIAGTPFDLGNAVNLWDEPHHAVFLAWARAPWTGY